MNLKKVISLSFVLLFGTTVVAFAANNNRNVYSIYSDNFNGAHIYDASVSVPTTDTDGIKVYPWKTEWQTPSHLTMTVDTVIAPETDPAPEGKEYMKCLWGSTEGTNPYTYNYAGCGYTRVQGIETVSSIDMAAYAGGQIKFSARSSKNYATKCQIGIQYADKSEHWFPSKLTNINSTWQEFSFTIPSDVSSKNVSVLFMFRIVEEQSTTTHPVGDEFLNIDNIRWVQSSGAASLDIVKKKVSDNTPVSDQDAPISFSVETFGQGWRTADQYLELDVDGDFSSKNWNIRVFSSATEEEKAGLYNNIVDKKLPMAWKISWKTLPYDYIDDDGRDNVNTLQIGENINTETGDVWGLYDAGNVAYLTEHYGQAVGDGAKWWYPWLYIQTKNDTSDNSLVLNMVGCHTFENDNKPSIEAFTNVLSDSYDRKPKLFLACDTKTAQSVIYSGSLIISLSYDE